MCASETSPGRGGEPPPTRPATEMVWCGARNGRSERSPWPCRSLPATDQIDRAAPDERLRDLQGLLAGIGLRDEQVLDADAELSRVAHVERMLGVDERGAPSLRLHLRDGVEAQGGLPAALRAVDLDDAAARIAAASEREVEADRAGLDHRDGRVDVLRVSEAHDGALTELLFDGAHGA